MTACCPAAVREVVPISLSVVAYIIIGFVGAVLGAGLYEVLRRRSALARRAEAEDQSTQVVQSAQREAENPRARAGIRDPKIQPVPVVVHARFELIDRYRAQPV